MNITKLTEQYVSGHPSIKDALKKDLINYSALSREICEELKIKKFDAVLIACRRYFWKLKKEDIIHEKDIIALMKTAKLKIRNKISVAIIEKPRDLESVYLLQKAIKKRKGDFNLIEGEEAITLITNSEYIEEIKNIYRLKIIKINLNLIQLALVFDEKIEITSGVVSYIYNIFSENGINIVEEMSCWTDLIIIIDEKDIKKAMDILTF